MILIAVLYAIFAAMTFINSKLMLTNPYPFFVGMSRAFGSSIFLIIFALMFQRQALKQFRLSSQAWKDLLVFGVFVHGIAMCGFSYGMQYTDPVKMCFVFAMNPFITAILQYFLHSEILTLKKILGLFIGFCGLVPILLQGDHGVYAGVSFELELLGSIVGIIAIVFFAYGWIAMKRFLKDNAHHPMAIINSIPMFAGGCVSLLLFLISVQGDFGRVTFSDDFPRLMGAFVVSSLLTYLIYAYLLTMYSATFIAFTGFLEPVFGLLFGMIFMGHSMTFVSMISLVVVFLGLYLFYQEELKAPEINITTDPDM